MNDNPLNQLDSRLVHELVRKAGQGVTLSELTDLIRQRLGIKDGMVPVLAYLCASFSIPLPLAIPLRESEGRGPFSRALQVCAWFSALLPDYLEPEPLDWNAFWKSAGTEFSTREARHIPVSDGELQCWQFGDSPKQQFVRGIFEVYIDKLEGFGPADRTVFESVCRWFREFGELYTGNEKASAQVKVEFQIEDQGPKYRICCMLRALGRSPSSISGLAAKT